ncbi:MAG: hypothetical protein ACE5DR_06765, partial [Thermodesulfobacteriota bacterium]
CPLHNLPPLMLLKRLSNDNRTYRLSLLTVLYHKYKEEVYPPKVGISDKFEKKSITEEVSAIFS